MSAESIAIKAVTETVKATENVVKKIWTLLDAASEKEQPSKFLSQQAVEAIQGRTNPKA